MRICRKILKPFGERKGHILNNVMFYMQRFFLFNDQMLVLKYT